MARIRPIDEPRANCSPPAAVAAARPAKAGNVDHGLSASDALSPADLLKLREIDGRGGWHLAVMDGDREIGRMACVGRWLWALKDGRSGYAASRAEALAALARAWA